MQLPQHKICKNMSVHLLVLSRIQEIIGKWKPVIFPVLCSGLTSAEKRLSSLSSWYQQCSIIVLWAVLWTAPLKLRIQWKTELSWSNTSKSNYKKNWQRNILWFNPPYSTSIKIKIDRFFLQLIKINFTKVHKILKNFNRNNLKLSYLCMPNIKIKINAGNREIVQNTSSKKYQTL